METDINFNRIFTFLHAENELKIQQKSTEISQEYPFLSRVTVSWMLQIKWTHFRGFFIYLYEGICMSSLPIVDEFLQLVVVLTVSPAKLYGEDELKV